MQALELLCPVWPAPANVIAGVTTRVGGVSEAPYNAFNLALHVNDAENAVRANRQQLADFCRHELASNNGLTQRWHWLEQTHGTEVRQFTEASDNHQKVVVADGGISCTPGQVCVVLTADCLPLLLCDNSGRCVGAVHVGWRGLVEGIIDKALIAMRDGTQHSSQETPRPDFRNIYAWLGPAIGPKHFVVGDDVRDRAIGYFGDSTGPAGNLQRAASEAFEAIHATSSQAVASRAANAANTPVAAAASNGNKYLADLYQLATLALHRNGVQHIYGGGFCTFSDPKRFFSYRRDGITGRMASFIFIDAQPAIL